jgi:hypothetical protein
MLKWPPIKTWLLALLWVTVTYIVAADLLPNLLLIAVNSAGYLPYSDRPGPGWQRPHFPDIQELQFFFGFGLLLLRGTAFYGGLFAALAWLLGFCHLPSWGLRLIATPLAFLSAGIMMAAAGWMIAIFSVGVYIAAVCGGFWGLLVFPRLVPKPFCTLPLAIRVVAPLLAFGAGGYWLIRPLLPNRALTNAKVEVVRRDATREAPLSLDYLGSDFAGSIKEASQYTSVSRLEFATDGKNQVRALLIVDDPQPVPHTFVLPRTGTAVYRQSHGIWKEEHTSGNLSDISVTLTAFNSTLQIQGPCCSSMSSGFAPYR